MDPHNLKMLNQLHPKLRPIAIKAWQECEDAMPPTTKLWIDQTYRTFAQSHALYLQGRFGDTRPVVTNADAGRSLHNYALAIDMHMITKGKDDWQVGPLWRKVAAIMKSHGFQWGGDWSSLKDYPHFEYTFGYDWRYLLSLWNSGAKDKDGYVQI